MDSFLFWLWKPLAELAFGLGIAALLSLIYLALQVPRWVKQKLCKHPRVFETGACDAVCRHCGKNLGFIGKWRSSGGG
jgi:hypothetical protein